MASSRSHSNKQTPAAILGPRLLILLATLALVLIGLVMVYSASTVKAITEGSDAASYVIKQALSAGIGIVVAVVIWKAPILRLLHTRRFNWGLWAVTFGLLVATALFGTGDEEWGAKRWLYIAGFSLQTSEFAKISFAVFTAFLWNEYRDGTMDFRSFAVSFFVMVLGPTLFLYYFQSDLGTTLIIAMAIITVLWLGEMPWQIIAIVILLGLGFAMLSTVTSSYRSSRFIYLNPWDDGQNGLGDGWQIIHSYWAFAEGGIFGVGLGNSYEKYSYLPMAETDFIYAIIGEELGLIGALVVMALFVVLLICGLRITNNASNPFSSMLAGSITVMLIFQAFLNMGCAVGVFPTTGKPLPFISSGGSSMMASLMMIGLLLAVSDESAAPSVHDKRRENLQVVHAVDNHNPAGGFIATRTNGNIPLGNNRAPRKPSGTRRR